MKATSTRAVLGLMILVCAPAMASIPGEVDIRLGGAELVLPNTYVVAQGDLVSLAVTAASGDTIWAFALPLDANLEWTGDFALTLLFERDVMSGQLSGDIMVPHGASGDFLVAAIAISLKGEIKHSVNKIVKVRPGMVKPTRHPDAGDPSLLEE